MREGDGNVKAKRLLAAAALGLGALVAFSQASAQGFYLGASAGSSDADDANAIPGLITSGSVDGKDSGLKLFGGYEFTKNFALELALVDLGTLSYSGSFGPFPVTGGKLDTTGFNFSAVGNLPLNPSFSLFAKAGLFFWDAEAQDITGGVPFSGSDNDVDFSLGFGGAYHFNRNFSVRAEWEMFKALDDISLLSVGVAYKF
jgi:OOP family OmpA-OmpF porin